MGIKKWFSFRGIITRRKPEMPSVMPWGVAVRTFYYHLIAKMMARGVGVKEANAKLTQAFTERTPEIEELLLDVIREYAIHTGQQITLEEHHEIQG